MILDGAELAVHLSRDPEAVVAELALGLVAEVGQPRITAGRAQDPAQVELERRALAGPEVERGTEDDRKALDPVVGAPGGEQQRGPDLAGLEAGAGRRQVADAPPSLPDRQQSVLVLHHRRGVPVHPLASRVVRHRGTNEPAADHEDVAANLGARQQVQGTVGDGDRPVHPAADPESAAIDRETAHEATALGQGDVPFHPRGGRVVVERDELFHHLRRRAPQLERVRGRRVGVDHDDAVLGPRHGGKRQHEEQGGEACSEGAEWACHSVPSAAFSIPRRRMRR